MVVCCLASEPCLQGLLRALVCSHPLHELAVCNMRLARLCEDKASFQYEKNMYASNTTILDCAFASIQSTKPFIVQHGIRHKKKGRNQFQVPNAARAYLDISSHMGIAWCLAAFTSFSCICFHTWHVSNRCTDSKMRFLGHYYRSVSINIHIHIHTKASPLIFHA